MGLKVRIPNALTFNRLMISGNFIPFPFGVYSHECANGVFSLSLHPISLLDLCDILERFEMLVVFDVSPLDGAPQAPGLDIPEDVVTLDELRAFLAEAAAARGSSSPPAPHVAEPVPLSDTVARWDVGCHAVDDNAVVIAGRDLAGLLSGLNHYNFHAFDVPVDHTRDDVVDGLSSSRGQEWSNADPLLPRLPHASFFSTVTMTAI
jgi:hypothetical protein